MMSKGGATKVRRRSLSRQQRACLQLIASFTDQEQCLTPNDIANSVGATSFGDGKGQNEALSLPRSPRGKLQV